MAEKGIHATITFSDRQRKVYMEQFGRQVILNLQGEGHVPVSIVLEPCDARLIAGWLSDMAHAAQCARGSCEAVIGDAAK